MITENFAQHGWQCPICKRVYSPFTPSCFYCGNEQIITTTGATTARTDWVEHQKEPSSFTSVSTGYAQFSAEDIRTCDYCKHNAGLPRNNGTTEYSGACKKCVAKDMWEAKKDET